ncbi:MAG: type II toxin-antitoxin system VapB family antitoxin [Azoarcus sp.]|jgi:antitoxin VapB|nr:type II toxin-antitoxin system VapB family antitoxin [Azoarcus sp.]
MTISTVFIDNRTQAVRLPADPRFPDTLEKVNERVVGKERVIAPLNAMWNSFFLDGQMPSADFMEARAPLPAKGDPS